MSEKKLSGKYNSNFTSFIGALEGALAILEAPMNTYELMGGTGFAFRMNIHPRLLLAPLDFPWGDELGYAINRLGYACRSMRSLPRLPVFDVYKAQGHHLILKGIDSGKASIVWNIPDGYFGLVIGYNGEKEIYYVSGIQGEKEVQEIPFADLGKGQNQALAVYQPTKKICEDSEKEKALSVFHYAVEHGKGKAGLFRGSFVGLDGYDLWKNTVTQDDLDPFGASYTAQKLSESRKYVPMYLEKVEPCFNSSEMEIAKKHYLEVAKHLEEVASLFPFTWKDTVLPSKEERQKASSLIQQAKDSETKGLESLEKIVK